MDILFRYQRVRKKFDINSECNFYEIIYKLWECVGYGIETEIKTKY